MDFMSDNMATGRRFLRLNIVDDFTRECPAIEVDTSLPGARVVRVLERLNDREMGERVQRGPSVQLAEKCDADGIRNQREQ